MGVKSWVRGRESARTAGARAARKRVGLMVDRTKPTREDLPGARNKQRQGGFEVKRVELARQQVHCNCRRQ